MVPARLVHWVVVLAGMGALVAQAKDAPVPAASDALPLTGTAPAPARSELRPPPRIPAQAFAQSAPFANLVMSPKGTRVLATSTKGSAVSLMVFDLTTGKALVLALPEKADLIDYGWAGDQRVLIHLGWTVPWFDDEAYATRLYVYDLAADRMQLIGKRDEGLRGDDVLYVDPAGDWLLLSMQRTVFDNPAVFRVNLSTLKREIVVSAVLRVWSWYADNSGVVRVGVGVHDGSRFLLYRKSVDEKFRRIAGPNHEDQSVIEALRVNPGTDEGFVLSNAKTGRFALYRYNCATQALGDVVFESETNDVDDYVTDATGTVVRAVRYADDRPRTAWLDPLMKRYQRDLEAANPSKMISFVSTNADDTRFIVWIGADDDPGAYYLFTPDSGPLLRIVRVNDGLSPAHLTKTQYTHYRARDGLDIPAYLTLPAGRDAKGLPLVIMPHGGPYDVRDVLQFDPEVQFLANRGYVVLQPNYRGSGGYGRALYKRGEGQWGRAMQDDLDDGMDWLVAQGIVDAKRVCLVGGSYGGYAALWGATRNPERYRCAVSFAGISDMGRQLKYQVNMMRSRHRERWRATVLGDDDFDLDTISPLKQVGRLQVPILLGHGDEDQRVPFKQSSLYDVALTKAGKPHEFYTYKGEGHGLADPANHAHWLDRLDAFLAKYNPAQ